MNFLKGSENLKFNIYSRKSVETGRGESIENQIEMCRDYILTNYPGTVERDIRVYEDEGFSGKTLERPQFKKMMADLQQEKPDCIVCYRLDRISRSVGDFAGLIESLNRKDIAFICIREKFDTSTPMGKAMMYIASVFAQLERETIAERVRDNMVLLAKMGRWLGGQTPTGFASEKLEEIIIDGKVKCSCRLTPNHEELAVVMLIFEKMLELRSISGVRKYLARQQIVSRSGKVFSSLGIKEILQNPVYCVADRAAWTYFSQRGAEVCFAESECSDTLGLLSYNKRDYSKEGALRNPIEKWIIAMGKHQGIISGERWVAIQTILEGNKPQNGIAPPHNHYSLLSGMIYCSKCGSRMFAKRRSGARGEAGQFDYICQQKLQLGASICDCQNLNGEEADGTLCEYLRSYKIPTSGLCRQLERLQRELKADEGPNPIKHIDQRMEECSREIERLVTALSQSETSSLLVKHVSTRVAELEEELNALRQEKAELELAASGESQQEIQLEMFGKALAAFDENFEEMSTAEQRTLIRLLVQKCEWDGEDLHIFIYGE